MEIMFKRASKGFTFLNRARKLLIFGMLIDIENLLIEGIYN